MYRCHAGRFKRIRPHEHRLECIKTFIIGHETKLLMFSVSINPSKCVIKQTHLRILIRCLKAHSKCPCMWTELINFIIVCPLSNSPSNRYKTSALHTNKCFSWTNCALSYFNVSNCSYDHVEEIRLRKCCTRKTNRNENLKCFQKRN